ncbi:hypothetical protein GUITHDRAFT_116258 [Guillardia theta CCMP2712]|uniref:Uncharacterized protein n=1 Tax=Guillardia theta (strain CCMP2712) TaxID=905079 RepID=L1IMW4_GUITC|nr:hypothetical protein GUITHDRAFT_116258 [Guillardia theta CCMP2712]EKX37621.1 hypothetical protein GUITHDRAFT_116258 [Guillardia theta CCMP2712]|eukprot:XP_005824601.1 hypothetical protein GUITHDRAFT_116258 [Guillardia theta CCMP2712]
MVISLTAAGHVNPSDTGRRQEGEERKRGEAGRMMTAVLFLAMFASSSADYQGDWDRAVKEGKEHAFIPAEGSAYFCKSKDEYVREANHSDGYFFCQDYVDYAAACDAQDRRSCNNRVIQKLSTSPEHIYKKMYLPGTERTEQGKVKKSYPADCSKISQDSTSSTNLYLAKHGCYGNVFLDDTASSIDDFYVNSIIEIISDTETNGQWAVISKYSGFSRLAMFDKWKLPAGSQRVEAAAVTETDNYRIYLSEDARGKCRNSKNPAQRMGAPCELAQYPDLAWLPNEFMGGTRCLESEQCHKIDSKYISPTAANLFDVNGYPRLPESKYACCQRDGITIVDNKKGTNGTLEEMWNIYTLESTNNSGQIQHNCSWRQGNTQEEAIAAKPTKSFVTTLATQAIEASGCIFNFSRTRDFALDFCVLKTCFPVCMDVVRKCPLEIEFNCPTDSDRREYDYSACNINLAEGCSMVLISSAAEAKLDRRQVRDWATCRNKGSNVGIVAIEPPKQLPAAVGTGEKEESNKFWEARKDEGGKMLRYFNAYGSKKETDWCWVKEKVEI